MFRLIYNSHAIQPKTMSIAPYDNAPERRAIRTCRYKIDASPEPQQHQAAESNKAAEDNPIPPLLCANPLHKPVDTRYLCSSSCDPPLDAAETFSLQCKALIHGVRLAEYRVGHVVAVVQSPPFVEHIVCFCRFWVVACPVCTYI